MRSKFILRSSGVRGHQKKMRGSQKFVPPTRTNTRTVQPDVGYSRTPKCRRLYSDPADAIFSSTPELPSPSKTPKPPTPRNNHQTQETGLTMGKPFMRRLQRNKKGKQTTDIAVTSPSSNLTQKSPLLLAPKPLKSIERQTANVDHETNQLMMSEAIPAVQNHLVQIPDSAPYDCASIFNFTPSPPPKRRATTASEKRKICLDVLLTVYKMKNQLQVLSERRQRLALKCQKRTGSGVRGEE